MSLTSFSSQCLRHWGSDCLLVCSPQPDEKERAGNGAAAAAAWTAIPEPRKCSKTRGNSSVVDQRRWHLLNEPCVYRRKGLKVKPWPCAWEPGHYVCVLDHMLNGFLMSQGNIIYIGSEVEADEEKVFTL